MKEVYVYMWTGSCYDKKGRRTEREEVGSFVAYDERFGMKGLE